MKTICRLALAALVFYSGIAFGNDDIESIKSGSGVLFNEPQKVDPMPETRQIFVDGKLVRLEGALDFRDKDLSGVKINNVTFVRVDFSGANLSNANLDETCFYQCNFQRAIFSGAQAMDGACFPKCDFTNALIGHSSYLTLSREQFVSTLDYKNKNFSFSIHYPRQEFNHTIGLDFSKSFFSNSSGMNAQGCNLSNALFVNFCRVLNMTGKQFISTRNYKDKTFTGTLFLENLGKEPLSLSGVDLSKSRIVDLIFTKYDVSGLDLTDAEIFGSLCFYGCVGLTPEQIKSTRNWKNRRFSFGFSGIELDWSNTDFSGFTFEANNALWRGNVAGADFTDAKFKGRAYLTKCKNLTLEQIKSTWNYKTNDMSELRLPPEIQQQLDEEAKAAPNGEASEAE